MTKVGIQSTVSTQSRVSVYDFMREACDTNFVKSMLTKIDSQIAGNNKDI